MIASEIKQKMKRAARGELTYGSGAACDVERIASVEGVLELRIGRQYGGNPPVSLHARIYFSEPSGVSAALWLLTIDVKHDYPIGKDEQNSQAIRAESRLESCYFPEKLVL